MEMPFILSRFSASLHHRRSRGEGHTHQQVDFTVADKRERRIAATSVVAVCVPIVAVCVPADGKHQLKPRSIIRRLGDEGVRGRKRLRVFARNEGSGVEQVHIRTRV